MGFWSRLFTRRTPEGEYQNGVDRATKFLNGNPSRADVELKVRGTKQDIYYSENEIEAAFLDGYLVVLESALASTDETPEPEETIDPVFNGLVQKPPHA